MLSVVDIEGPSVDLTAAGNFTIAAPAPGFTGLFLGAYLVGGPTSNTAGNATVFFGVNNPHANGNLTAVVTVNSAFEGVGNVTYVAPLTESLSGQKGGVQAITANNTITFTVQGTTTGTQRVTPHVLYTQTNR